MFTGIVDLWNLIKDWNMNNSLSSLQLKLWLKLMSLSKTKLIGYFNSKLRWSTKKTLIKMCISHFPHINTSSYSSPTFKRLWRNLSPVALFWVTFASRLWMLAAVLCLAMVWELYGLAEGSDCKAVVASHSDCPQNLHSYTQLQSYTQPHFIRTSNKY